MAKKAAKRAAPRSRAVPFRPLDEVMLRRFVFQTFGRTRKTQDSPIVPDVWLRYIRIAEEAARARLKNDSKNRDAQSNAVDLLLTPWTGTSPGEIAARLRLELGAQHSKAQIAQSTSRVVAKIDLISLVRIVVPLSGWWQTLYRDPEKFRYAFDWLAAHFDHGGTLKAALREFSSDIEFFRYAVLVGFINQLMNAKSVAALAKLEKLAQQLGGAPEVSEQEDSQDQHAFDDDSRLQLRDVRLLFDGYKNAMGDALHASTSPKGKNGRPISIYVINANRPAAPSLFDSRNTVKADAAERLFDISGRGLAFAVIDGGIDAEHPAFLKRREEAFKERDWGKQPFTRADLSDWSRIKHTYDFTILRDVINVAVSDDPQAASEENRDRVKRLYDADKKKDVKAFDHLKIRGENARDLDWEIVEPLIKIPYDDEYIPPGTDHGTHVAGILAADLEEPDDIDRPLIGMCRDLTLYDLRVFDGEGRGDEFAILCAVEFVDWLNRDRKNPVIHGINLSLALRHDVDSFACGQTPICEACNHLVGSGTVVVAAAGNTGFEGAANKQSLGNGYRSISITDPGNAEAVITVGSTHRRDPHTYGVSFFSGRGPTGDGRRKPDILAPGEKITSTVRNGRSQRMDGTSMAAPHVSGAAAILMARYPELIGRPLRIKEILMAAATDLKREPYFQGAGLLDVLRALQSV